MNRNRTVVILSTAALLVMLALFAVPGAKKNHHKKAAAAVAHPTLTLPKATAATGPLSVTARLPGTWAANAAAPNYVTIDIAAAHLASLESGEREPVNLALVVDVSGSMQGDKIVRAREAAVALIEKLGPKDRIALVKYSSDADAQPSRPATADNKAELLAWAYGLEANGATNISAGLDAGERAVAPYLSDYKATRLILVSDGRATNGITSHHGLAQISARLRANGVTVTALGVGNDFDEVLMRGVAESGAGFYGYLQDVARLSEVLEAELNQASQLVARKVVVTFEPAEGVVLEEALGKPLVTTELGNGVQLYDFSSGLNAKVIARLSVDRATSEVPVELGRVHVTYEDLNTKATVRAITTLRAPITADAQRALENADPAVVEHAARAEAARHMQAAAALMREGKSDEAERTLSFGYDSLRKTFGSSANALAGDMRTTRGLSASENAKNFESKSMKNFGHNNSY